MKVQGNGNTIVVEFMEGERATPPIEKMRERCNALRPEVHRWTNAKLLPENAGVHFNPVTDERETRI